MDVFLGAFVVPASLAALESPIWPGIALCSCWAVRERLGLGIHNSAILIPACITFLTGALIKEARMEADAVLGLLALAAFLSLWPYPAAWLRLGIQWPERVIVLEAMMTCVALLARSVLLEVKFREPKAEGTPAKQYNRHPSEPEGRPDTPASPVIFVVQTLLASTVLFCLFLAPFASRESKGAARASGGMGRLPTTVYYGAALAAYGGMAYPLLSWKLKIEPVSWLLAFLDSPLRKGLCMWWLTVLALTLPLASRFGRAGSSPLILTRKVFHYAIVCIIGPALCMGPHAHALVAVACAGATVVLVLLEGARALRVGPAVLSDAIHGYMSTFVDARDSGSVYTTHLYLLIGCACPVWLSYARARPMGSTALPSMLELASGILALGISDAAAAVVGISCQSLGIGHTWAWVLDRALTALGTPDYVDGEEEEDFPQGQEEVAAAKLLDVVGLGSLMTVSTQPKPVGAPGPVPDEGRQAKVRGRSASPASRARVVRRAPSAGGAGRVEGKDRPSRASRTPEELFPFPGSTKTLEGSTAFVFAFMGALYACLCVHSQVSAWAHGPGAPSWAAQAIPAPIAQGKGLLYWAVAAGLAVLGSVTETFGGCIDNVALPAIVWCAAVAATDSWLG